MSSILEKLAGAKALIEAAIEQELDRIGAPPPSAPAAEGCEHKNSEEITGAGQGPRRRACVDCGHTWEVE
jgi:hypothetical protein